MVINLVITIDLSAPTTGTVETRLMPRSGLAAQATIMDAFLTEKKLVSGCSECRKGTAAIGIGKQTDNNGNRENCDSCFTRNFNGLEISNRYNRFLSLKK